MSAPFPAQGELFEGRYRVGPLIGTGGYARVYRARLEDLERDVALKVLTPTNLNDDKKYGEKLANRFIREAKLVSQLRDPHTITMFDYGQTNEGLLYMVFEYISGVSLAELIEREGALAPERVVKILKQVLSSLEEAHAHDYLHRDIKPGNIMVFEHVGRADQVKVLDFGIAKVMDGKSTLNVDLTADGIVLGTPRYMSPEQICGHPVNPQSDLYSLGLVAFELVMGHSAIDSNSTFTIIDQQLALEPFEIPEMQGCPAGLRNIINRMLAKDRDMRYRDAQEVLDALESWHAPEGSDIGLDPHVNSADSVLQTQRIEDPQGQLVNDTNARQLFGHSGNLDEQNRSELHPPRSVPEQSAGPSQPSNELSDDFQDSKPPQPSSNIKASFREHERRPTDDTMALPGEPYGDHVMATNPAYFDRDGQRSSPGPAAKSKIKFMVGGGIGALVFAIIAMLGADLLQNDEKEHEKTGREVAKDSRFGVDSRGIHYVFIDHTGSSQRASRLAEIPQAYRKHVAVQSGGLPETDLTWVADLSEVRPGAILEAREGSIEDGHPFSHAGAWGQTRAVFVVQNAEYTVERPEPSRKAKRGKRLPSAKPGLVIDYVSSASPSSSVPKSASSSGRHVTMYRTESCGRCRSAKRWLDAEGIPHTEKDVEKSRANYDEWRRVCRTAGKRCGGVPTFAAGGEVVQGFNKRKLNALVRR